MLGIVNKAKAETSSNSLYKTYMCADSQPWKEIKCKVNDSSKNEHFLLELVCSWLSTLMLNVF